MKSERLLKLEAFGSLRFEIAKIVKTRSLWNFAI
nr:MAG TPA: hypothetical protein [Caudoviricetes sp.]